MGLIGGKFYTQHVDFAQFFVPTNTVIGLRGSIYFTSRFTMVPDHNNWEQRKQ